MTAFDIYDKQGNPITIEQFEELKFGGDMEYHRVGSTDVGPYWISTVWLGMDHRFIGEGPPVIFETMVFSKGDRDDPEHRGLAEFDTMRYCTEEEALAGHDAMVLLVEATYQEEFDPNHEEETNGHHQGGQGGADQDSAEEPEEAQEALPGGAGDLSPADDRGARPSSGRGQERGQDHSCLLPSGPGGPHG